MKRLLPKQTILSLNPKESLPQFTRSTTFADGLKQAGEIFKRKYKIIAPGMRKPYWLDNLDDHKNSNVCTLNFPFGNSCNFFKPLDKNNSTPSTSLKG